MDEPLPGFLAAQSFLPGSKVLDHLGCRDAPEGGRELVHCIAKLRDHLIQIIYVEMAAVLAILLVFPPGLVPI